MKWQDKRVLVTGAGGFIGSHLVDELLNKGAEVTAFVHYNARNDWGMLEGRYTDKTPNLKVIAGDVTDPLFVKKAVSEKEVRIPPRRTYWHPLFLRCTGVLHQHQYQRYAQYHAGMP